MTRLLLISVIHGCSVIVFLCQPCCGSGQTVGSVAKAAAEKWQQMVNDGKQEAVFAETARLKRSQDHDLAREALFFSTRLNGAFGTRRLQFRQDLDEFCDRFPDDDRLPYLLLTWARKHLADNEQVAELRRIADKYPNSKAATYAVGLLRQADSLGKPLILEFRDMITGKQIKSAQFAGKWVVLDFWATWCAPCVALTPHLVELQNAAGGTLVVIGVNLDDGDDAAELVTQYARKAEIEWPQCLGRAHAVLDLGKHWGIATIPRLFLIDPDGILVDTDTGIPSIRQRLALE